MHILKYVLYAILVLVLIFLALGFIKPTVTFGHEITADKPLKEAWAVHQDDSKLGLWLKGFKSIELISGNPKAVGSKYKVIVNPDGKKDFEMIETITSVKEFDHMSLQFDSDAMIFDVTTSFADKGGKTVVKTESEVKGKGVLARSMFALMGMAGSFQKQEVRHIEGLKKVIEANTTDYYPSPMINVTVDSTALDKALE